MARLLAAPLGRLQCAQFSAAAAAMRCHATSGAMRCTHTLCHAPTTSRGLAARPTARLAPAHLRVASSCTSTSRAQLQRRRLHVVAASSQESVDELYARVKEVVLEDEMLMEPEEQQYWKEQIAKCTKQQAIRKAALLDWRYKTGLNPAFAPGERPNCFNDMLLGKVKHPTAVSLVKVGTFYEAAGIDAILLVEHCGVNFMGRRSIQAGVPDKNLPATLRQLVREAGLEVAITEEVGDAGDGKMKQRELVQLVTPENPQYMYRFAESSTEVDLEAPSICGLVSTSRGYCVYVYNPASSTVTQDESQSLDAAWGHIFADSSSKPIVYCHRPLDNPKAADKWVSKVKKHLKDVRWHEYTSADALQGFKTELLKRKGLPPDTPIEVVKRDWSQGGINSVRALYYSTASQLGLTPSEHNVPSLVGYVVPEGSRKVVRDTMNNLLTSPPPYSVAASTRQAVKQLMALDTALPEFCARGMTPKKVAVVLDMQEGNAAIFQALMADLQSVLKVLGPGRTRQSADLVQALWPLLLHTMNNTPGRLTEQQVLTAAQRALELIDRVVVSDTFSRQLGLDSSDGSDSNDEDAPAAPVRRGGKAAVLTLDLADALREADRVTEQFADEVETWQRRVKPTALQAQLGEAYLDICDTFTATVAALLWAVYQRAAVAGVQLTNKNLPTVVADNISKTVRLKVPESLRRHVVGVPLHLRYQDCRQPVDIPNQELRAPVGDRRKLSSNNYSCSALDSILARYLDTAAEVNAAASAVLKQLAVDLSGLKAELAAAVQLGVLLTTLSEHSRAAKAAGWTVPLVGGKEQEAAGIGSTEAHPAHDGVLDLRGLWPYWMPGRDAGTVKNDARLDGFMLLTGPNMAGKSTVLRAVAAAALCGSVGLAVPAAAGSQLPLLDAVILRTFSGDAPQEGLSAYAVEMAEMGTVLQDVQPCSLVLVDELGKGTEVMSGTSIAGAILRGLAHKGAIGVFATHLHLLVDRLAGHPRITNYRMEVVSQAPDGAQADADAGADGTGPSVSDPYSYLYSMRPTWRLLPGTCFESLAFAVARDCGVPADVLAEAAADYAAILAGGSSRPGYDAIAQIARSTTAGQLSSGSSSLDTGGSSLSSSSGDDGGSSSGGGTTERCVGSGGVAAAAVSCSEVSSSSSSSDGSDADWEQPAGDARGEAATGAAAAAAAAGSQQLPVFVSSRQARLAQLLQVGSSSSDQEAAARLEAARGSATLLLSQLADGFALQAPAAADDDHTSTESPQDAASAAAAAAAAAGEDRQGLGRRRRRGRSQGDTQQQQQQQQQQQPHHQQQHVEEQGAEASPEYGVVVHELVPGMVPPPSHDGESVVYILQDPQGWWYAGETQALRQRLATHRRPSNFGKQLVAWYVVLPPGADRKVLQGRLIRSAERLGLMMASNRDAAMARKK